MKVKTENATLVREISSRALLVDNEIERLEIKRKNRDSKRLEAVEDDIKDIKNLLLKLIKDRN